MDVVNVGGILDTCLGHRPADTFRHLLHHCHPPDVLRQNRIAHRDTDGEAKLVRRLCVDFGKHRCVWTQNAVDAARPHHRNLLHFVSGTGALVHEHLAESLVGQDAREVVDATVAFRLADDTDDFVSCENSVVDQCR